MLSPSAAGNSAAGASARVASAHKAAAPAALTSYDMSDREGSSDEGEEEEEGGGERGKKPIPDWARGPALEAAIHGQYADASVRDPEAIFGSVAHCELEDIFRAKKKRYTKRTSSGLWAGDALTAGELSRYRADMGFTGGEGAPAGKQ